MRARTAPRDPGAAPVACAEEASVRPCAFCQGTGAVKTFACGACRGSGVVPEIAEDTVTCPECQGSGDAEGDPALSCLRCRGQGRVPAAKPH